MYSYHSAMITSYPNSLVASNPFPTKLILPGLSAFAHFPFFHTCPPAHLLWRISSQRQTHSHDTSFLPPFSPRPTYTNTSSNMLTADTLAKALATTMQQGLMSMQSNGAGLSFAQFPEMLNLVTFQQWEYRTMQACVASHVRNIT